MVAGEAGQPWAIHLTFLEDFQPVREGKLTLRFVGPDSKDYTTVAETPARDGIFTPAPSLPNGGAYQLAMTLEGPRGKEEISVGEIRVFGSSADLPHVEDAPATGISFLKEQQWVTPFATAAAIERELRRSLSANGEIVPVPNAVASVTAPVEGLVRAKHNLRALVGSGHRRRGRSSPFGRAQRRRSGSDRKRRPCGEISFRPGPVRPSVPRRGRAQPQRHLPRSLQIERAVLTLGTSPRR